MEAQFVIFQSFNEKNPALALGNLLAENNIEYILEDNSAGLDLTFGGNDLIKEFLIKIRKEDFSAADEAVIHASIHDIDSVDKDYYLFGFTDEELRDVVVKKDEWSIYDYLLAQRLLLDRGKEIGDEELHRLRQERIEELAKPNKIQSEAIVIGYIFALVGGLVGILIGWYLMSTKKTLPNGDRIYNYTESDRRHGKIILILGLFFFVLSVMAKVFWPMISDYSD